MITFEDNIKIIKVKTLKKLVKSNDNSRSY